MSAFFWQKNLSCDPASGVAVAQRPQHSIGEGTRVQRAGRDVPGGHRLFLPQTLPAIAAFSRRDKLKQYGAEPLSHAGDALRILGLEAENAQQELKGASDDGFDP